ncbi:hypothetical protein N0B51_04025 [Tsuneonella sp. YG55]|uniref:NIPSNAP domain-containing protein n=1 Tax=Tsuneonella litorea TaxID=2976475 RepID=A0A9X3AKB3_9SPHN|nr:hypothetical protein [Tsuneonella litorea]MCT2558139.1 hypothetical protein [Tsuneonella litorea]
MMTRHFTTLALAAACALATISTPVMAQSEPEQARTTYAVILLKLAPDAGGRWSEMMEKYYAPAAAAAGLPKTEVHWMMDGPWDLMLLRPMPRGLAALDTHASPERDAFNKSLAKIAGSEEAAKKLGEENDKLVTSSMRYFSHTHP